LSDGLALLTGEAFLNVFFGVTIHVRPEEGCSKLSHGGLKSRVTCYGSAMKFL